MPSCTARLLTDGLLYFDTLYKVRVSSGIAQSYYKYYLASSSMKVSGIKQFQIKETPCNALNASVQISSTNHVHTIVV